MCTCTETVHFGTVCGINVQSLCKCTVPVIQGKTLFRHSMREATKDGFGVLDPPVAEGTIKHNTEFYSHGTLYQAVTRGCVPLQVVNYIYRSQQWCETHVQYTARKCH